MIKKALISVKNFFVKDFEYFNIFSTTSSEKKQSEQLDQSITYRQNTDEDLIRNSKYAEVRSNYAAINHESRCYVAIHNEEIIGSCYVWDGDFYIKYRNFLSLETNEAELTFLVVSSDFRGQGIAVKLIDFARSEELRRGTTKLFARVWHSNGSSEKSFLKSGWIHEFSIIKFRLKYFNKLVSFKL
jgi:ribosomal protein S18 acetylase RimI-like enzyme